MRYQSKSRKAIERHAILRYAVIAIGLLAIVSLIYLINTMSDANY